MNVIKRTIIMAISLLYIISVSAVSTFAVNHENTSTDLKTVSTTMAESFTVVDFSESPQHETVDFSNAIDVTEQLINVESEQEADINNHTEQTPFAVPENQPPVADPAIFLLNPESMRDGFHTTDTLFFIATKWNNTDLCYDPEGGKITLAFDDSFPRGYITIDRKPTYEGYIIHIFNHGQYPFVFAFMDEYGGMSQAFTINFDIISRGVFTSIEGSLDSMTDVKEHDISVDYSVADEYSIGLLRVGKSMIAVDVYDENGEKCDTAYSDGPRSTQGINAKVVLKKPDGINREYTYKLRVRTDESGKYYVDGDSGYKIAYGESSQVPYFFEEVYDSMDLPYYHTVRDYNQVGAMYTSRLTTSEFGNYYKITTTGTETVTLTSTDGHLRFKVLDARTLDELFDGESYTPLTIENSTTKVPVYYVGLNINFEAGGTYYLLVYDPEPNSTYRSYSITVGETQVYSGYRTEHLADRTVTAGSTYTTEFTVPPVNSQSEMYVDKIGYHGYSADWAPEGGHFSVQSPGKSTWITNSLFYSNIDYNYWDANTVPVRADGTWKLRYTASKSGTCTGRWVRIYYATELYGYEGMT